MPLSPEALETWIAAVDEGYVGAPDWARWVERAVHAADHAPSWLMDLQRASARREAVALLRAGLAASSAEPPDVLVTISIRLGFVWLRHEREDLDLAEALERAIRIVDAAAGDSQAFHVLLAETDGGGPATPEPLSLNARASALFAPHTALARACLHHLGC